MAGGKVHHWKHGWIRIDAAVTSALVPKKRDDSAMISEADARAARLNAHRQHNAVRDQAMESRYAKHLVDTAARRAAMDQRYRDRHKA